MIDHNEPSFCWFAYRFKLLYFVFGCVSCLVWLMLMLMPLLIALLPYCLLLIAYCLWLWFAVCGLRF